MSKTARELIALACAAATRAHAPYSNFHVGAAIETEEGDTVSGCNVENASYGLTLCAERVAIHTAVASGHRTFTQIAIVASGDNPPYPCGACRQVLAEFCGPDLTIYVATSNALEDYEEMTLGQLLPKTFTL